MQYSRGIYLSYLELLRYTCKLEYREQYKTKRKERNLSGQERIFTLMQTQQIVYLLRSRVIPWATSAVANKIVVARQTMRADEMPDGIALSPREIVGKRRVVKDKRKHGNLRLHIADWPEDNLHELSVAKVMCVTQGNADVLVGKYCLHCPPGTFILVPPHLPHQRFGPFKKADRPVDEWCTVIHAYAHSQGLLFWLNHSSLAQHTNDKRNNYLISSVSAARILEMTIEETVDKKTYEETVGGCLLSSLFAIIARDIQLGNYLHPGPKEVFTPHRPTSSFADRVRDYLEANCHKPVKLEEIATHLFVSSSTFSRYMHKEMGMTFIEYLTQIRIERAKQMLRETNMTVIYIAGTLSFRSPTQFHQLFSKHVGCSPIKYRQKYSGNKNEEI